jgi:hypothetical protein
VNDVVREMSVVCHMKTFSDRLYAVCNASPINKAELESVTPQSGT